MRPHTPSPESSGKTKKSFPRSPSGRATSPSGPTNTTGQATSPSGLTGPRLSAAHSSPASDCATRSSKALLVRGFFWLIAAFVFGAAACSSTNEDTDLQVPLPSRETAVRTGGATTVFDETINAFARSAANLTTEQKRAFAVGNNFFNDNWVTAPASTTGRDGLGPTFNALSCSSCHFKDGRGRPPDQKSDDNALGLLLRLSIPGTGAHGGVQPVPAYGDQLNDRSIIGLPAEGSIGITHEEIRGSYADGTPYLMRKPIYTIIDPQFASLPENLLISPRVAPQMVGLGLLESIPEATIRALADPDDKNQDGISGRVNEVWDERRQETRLGRFGWKANQPTVTQQVAGAFLGDIGITSGIFPAENCPAEQKACSVAPNGGTPELDDHKLERVSFYSRTLAVPARRNWEDAEVARGERLFHQMDCALCHTPTLQTGENPEIPALSDQTIHPYTDLILHDMGPGLADGRPDFRATGTEWRTPPLWGIGLVKTVNGHTRFLHDGRARNLTEAVLWHGGEAEASQAAFLLLVAQDRAALIAFLQSL